MKGQCIQNPDLTGVESDQNFNLKCKYCLKNLSSRQNLREHTYIHTGEKPYICTEPGCEKKFRQGSLLSIHKKIHSEIIKGLNSQKKTERRCHYPKLTKLIEITNSNLDCVLDDQEKKEWIKEICLGDFMFLPSYMRDTVNK
ncbi:hypothetical protein SteCoe_6576 [Stentor coeruleus]|uniref:C2H2-type domain-containing protein n=1 Tax=Stentor coeruleus TaxID=5963 RepID=A0A1R2CPT3_9CILI|nr:hypothetical protein SteCoe_21980 [Stentor coeruleus]OMJ91002.1 hypothetical protein SteCoe_6576 [Stentor coeruleus]